MKYLYIDIILISVLALTLAVIGCGAGSKCSDGTPVAIMKVYDNAGKLVE